MALAFIIFIIMMVGWVSVPASEGGQRLPSYRYLFVYRGFIIYRDQEKCSREAKPLPGTG